MILLYIITAIIVIAVIFEKVTDHSEMGKQIGYLSSAIGRLQSKKADREDTDKLFYFIVIQEMLTNANIPFEKEIVVTDDDAKLGIIIEGENIELSEAGLKKLISEYGKKTLEKGL